MEGLSVATLSIQALDIGLHVKPLAMWEVEWKHNVTITSDYPKDNDVDWIFGCLV